jgi:hypothetical protein
VWVSNDEPDIVAFDVAARDSFWSLKYMVGALSKKAPGTVRITSYYRGDMEDLAFYKPTSMKLDSVTYDVDHWKEMVHHYVRLAIRRGTCPTSTTFPPRVASSWNVTAFPGPTMARRATGAQTPPLLNSE